MSHNLAAKKENTAKLVEKFGRTNANTGSTEVQVALLSNRIQSLTEHLKVHKKDFGTQTGLLKLVGQRRRLLDYLKVSAPSRYLKLIGELELRK